MNYDAALKACQTKNTRESYARCLAAFARWLNGRAVDYDNTLNFREHLVKAGDSPQSVNQHLAAIRFYAKQTVKRKEQPAEWAQSVCAVENLKIKGRKLGNWLKKAEAERLLNAPDTTHPQGVRDRAILGLFIGAGLRRSEICNLQVKHIERRDGRWVLVGIEGKHGRTRNVPVADWCKALVDVWTTKAGIRSGHIFRSVRWSEKKQKLTLGAKPLTPAMLYQIVKLYGRQIGRGQIAPHDLRRTFARLAFEGEAPIKQIQIALGHANQQTTEIYVNAEQNLQMSPSDVLGIEVKI